MTYMAAFDLAREREAYTLPGGLNRVKRGEQGVPYRRGQRLAGKGWGSGAAAVLAAFVVLGTFSLPSVHAAPGDLDPAFGTAGKVTTDFGGKDETSALVVQPDGKLVAAGRATGVNIGSDFALARYNPDGSLDPTFGTGGKVLTNFGGAHDLVSALVVQLDGKLVAAGSSDAFDNARRFALARYNPDGSLDPTFGIGGTVTTDIDGGDDTASALVLQPDGKLVAAGKISGVDTGSDFALARYNPDGSLDPTFGTGGKVLTNFGDSHDLAFGLVLQPDGKLVAAGSSQSVDSDFALARYNPDGSLDPTFGTDGTVTTDFGSSSDTAGALVRQPDGKLVAAGRATGVNIGSDFALARYNPDGSLDPTFGIGGRVASDFGGRNEAAALVLQPDGKLVAAGWRDASDNRSDFALARYNPDGSLDPTFGIGGRVASDFGGRNEAAALVLQPDGKLVAAGWTRHTGTRDFTLARYMGASSTAPDLTGDWLSFAQSCKGEGVEQKCKLKGKVQVQNLGNEKAPTESFLRFYMSADPVLDGGDTLLQQATVSRLKPRRVENKKIKHTLPTGQTASGQYLLAVLDATGLIAEQVKTNNILVLGPIP